SRSRSACSRLLIGCRPSSPADLGRTTSRRGSQPTLVCMAQKPRRRVAIVPHTHWDREWYQPYQTFRLRLVDLLDEFLPRLDRDPAYARFMLDGQMAVVDDYLEVRPEAEPVLRRLAGSGRLSM